MKTKDLDSDGQRTWTIVFEIGDEPMTGLQKFAREQKITAAHFIAIGGFENVTLTYFDCETKRYENIPLEEQLQVLVMVGDITLKDSLPKADAHLVVGRADGTIRGGHLTKASVRPTLDVMLIESAASCSESSIR